MLQEKKSKRGAWIALGCVAALLVLVIVLENTMQRTSMLFTVLKKGALRACSPWGRRASCCWAPTPTPF